MAFTTIDDPSEYFQAITWSAESSGDVTVTFGGNSDLQLDWLWSKCRNIGHSHALANSSVVSSGNYYYLLSDTNGAEDTGTDDLKTITSDGFTAGQDAHFGLSGRTYVGYGWKANGGSTSSNTDGSITSTVQASTASGFSIVTWTENGSDNATVGHGLGEKPKIIIPKRRDNTGHWLINNWVSEQDYAQKLKWNDTEAQTSSDSFVKDANSTTFTLGTDVDVNANTGTYVAYCFAEKQGFSKFGQYTGNGSTNGPFLYTGFTPNFFFVKRWDGTASWHLYDGEREKFNDGSRLAFKINTDEAEFSKNVDFLSNGVKFRDTTSDANTAGGAYIWAAFARHPFVSSKGVPITAL